MLRRRSAERLMVVNEQYRFIFVHIPKAAGSSIAAALSALPGDRPDWLGKGKHETLADFLRAAPRRKRLFERVLRPGFGGYSALAFVRNPWARHFSLYHFLRERPELARFAIPADFGDFLRMTADRDPSLMGLHSLKPQSAFIAGAPQGMPVLVGQVEHLEADLATISARLGAPLAAPRRNASAASGKDYRPAYDAAGAETIATLFADDVARFGYRFDDPLPHQRMLAPA
jgi:hypothetical protein